MNPLAQQIAARNHFIATRAAEMLEDRMMFKSIFDEALESTAELALLTGLRDAIAEIDRNWNGLRFFSAILTGVANQRAAEEWEAIGQTNKSTKCVMCHDTEEGQHDGARCGFCNRPQREEI